MLKITPVPIFSDNYVWLIIHEATRKAVAVDPGDSAPVQAFLQSNKLELAAILITHRHWDHISGVSGLVNQWNSPVYGPSDIDGVTHPVAEGSIIELLVKTGSPLKLDVLATPGHTQEHLVYYIADNEALFCGDTLFSAGCGRLQGGAAKQLKTSLDRIKKLPPSTRIYGAHEYTLENLRFASRVMPKNADVSNRLEKATHQRASGNPTLPVTLKEECLYNPFLRTDDTEIAASIAEQFATSPADEQEIFALLRKWKDHF